MISHPFFSEGAEHFSDHEEAVGQAQDYALTNRDDHWNVDLRCP